MAAAATTTATTSHSTISPKHKLLFSTHNHHHLNKNALGFRSENPIPVRSLSLSCIRQLNIQCKFLLLWLQPLMVETSKSSSDDAPTIVDVNLGDRSYPIYIGSGLFNQPDLLQRHIHGKRVLVVTNTIVAPLYLNKVVNALTVNNPNVQVESVILPDGEKYKDMDTLMKVFDKAIESRLDRRCTFVVLGGGVIGDMCGYVAASFLRGVNFIQIPTIVMYKKHIVQLVGSCKRNAYVQTVIVTMWKCWVDFFKKVNESYFGNQDPG